jgi:histidine triad (HIT) family protein
MDCLFCSIINKDIPSFKLYEDDFVYVFLDINPRENGHTLIIPKKHYLDMTDMDNEMIIHIFEVAKKIKKLLEEKLNIDGLTLVQNNGLSQEVKHYHLHLIPNYKSENALISVEEVYKKIKEN